jgi:ankyrin repeat protein
VDQQSPQAFLDKAIEARGYSTKQHCSLEGGYYCRPTPLQQASYGSRVSQAVRASDGILLRRLLDAGLSPNPCNSYGESLVHMVCRRGDHKTLRILLESGCSLQVTDDYGRTPLHDACWRVEPSFEAVQLILDSDKYLLHLLDCRGAAPLSYVKPENYEKWIEFLKTKLERFWPMRDIGTEGEERPPPLTLREPHSLPIPDPQTALPLEVVAMVSNGRMEPEEARYLDDSSDDESSYDSDEDSNDSYDSDNSEESDFDEEEMAEICLRAGGPMAIAKNCFGNDVRVVGGTRGKTA